MAEKPSIRDFISLQKQVFGNSRLRTAPSKGYERLQYRFISSGLKEYEEDLYRTSITGRHLLDDIKQVAEMRPGEPVRLLDFGCGHNAALRELAQSDLSGVKVEATGLGVGDPRNLEEKEIDENCNIKFIDQTDVKLNLPRDAYDIIISRLTFLHLANPLETMRSLYKSLRKNGVLRIHFKLNHELAPKMFNPAKNTPSQKPNLQQDQAHRIISDLENSGIDIKIDWPYVVIKKNDVKMKFPNVGLSGKGREGIWGVEDVYVYKDKQ